MSEAEASRSDRWPLPVARACGQGHPDFDHGPRYTDSAAATGGQPCGGPGDGQRREFSLAPDVAVRRTVLVRSCHMNPTRLNGLSRLSLALLMSAWSPLAGCASVTGIEKTAVPARSGPLAEATASKAALGVSTKVAAPSKPHGVLPLEVDRAVTPGNIGLSPSKDSKEDYTNYGVNSLVETLTDKLSTFAIDVDTASYAIARRKLTEGTLPPKDSVRVEEFLNSFDYGYGAPTDGPFAVHMHAAPSPFAKGHHLLRVGLQTKRPAASQRKPAHLVYLVDTSGSMQSPDKIGLIKESLRMLTSALEPKDTVAICTYAGDTREVLAPTGLADRGKILAAIDELTAGGGTAMSSGIETAYALATRTKYVGETNRVVVLSDGDANIGPSTHEEILRQIGQYKEQGITLSTVGFGDGNYQDTMMEQLADKGDGNYTYIDSPAAAHKAFVEKLGSLLEVLAKDVKVQVAFDPSIVTHYRLIGYENRVVADREFRNDSMDGGEVGAGHAVTALYDLELAPGAVGKSLATVAVRYKAPTGGQASERSFVMPPSNLVPELAAAPASLRLAVAIAGFAETLRESAYATGVDAALALAKGAVGQSNDEVELLRLMERASLLGVRRHVLVSAK